MPESFSHILSRCRTIVAGNHGFGVRLPLGFCAIVAVSALLMVLNSCGKSGANPAESSQEGWTITGKTILAGSTDALSGVVVTCSGQTTTSGPDGTYELRGVPRGAQILTAEKAGYDTYSGPIEVDGNITHFIYITYKTANLSGYVSNALDGAISGARVSFGSLNSITDNTGRYTIVGARRGTDTLLVHHPRYYEWTKIVSLNSPDTTCNTVLVRDTIFDVTVFAFNYVDQALPATFLPRWPNTDFLYVQTDGYDSTGVYVDSVEKDILIHFNFPPFMGDERAGVLEASMQMYLSSTYRPFQIKVYQVAEFWNGNVTFRSQPQLGTILYSGSVGDGSAPKYWVVLGIDGIKTLIDEYRKNGDTYGIEIKGGSTVAASFCSSSALANKPKLTMKVRF